MLVLLSLAISLSIGTGTRAQEDTPTPTPTPTATPTPPPTPDVNQYWIAPTTVDAEGTPEPWRWYSFAYEANIGDVAILVFLAAILFSLVAMSLIWFLSDRRKS